MGAGGDSTPTGCGRVPADDGQSEASNDATPGQADKVQADTGQKRLSPAAEAAIARYRRLMGNVSDANRPDETSDPARSDLDRHLAERPPHWAPPRGEQP